jgi:hypothetical protein
MAEETPTPTPQSDPLTTAGDKPAVVPTFQADDFLAGKKVKSAGAKANLAQPSAEPSPSSASSSVDSTPRAREKPPQMVKRGGVSFMTALFMSALATAGGAYLALFVQARPDVLKQAGIGQFLPQVPQGPTAASSAIGMEPLTQRVAAIEAQLAALQGRVDGLATKPDDQPIPQQGPSTPLPSSAAPNAVPPASTPPAAPSAAPAGAVVADVGLLKSELAGIGGRVTAIETRLAALDPTGAGGAVIAGLQADIASLKATITALQQQVAATPSPAVTMAVVNLAEAAGRSGPFLTEFETLRAAMGSVPEVAALEGFARTGVPTRTMLQERFSTLGPAIAAAAQSSQKEAGLVVWFRSLMSSMITVKPAPNANGKGGDDVLARAKTKLDQGDLSGCADDLVSIENPPVPVTEWIASARKRIDLESRLSAVRGVASRVPLPASTIAQGSPAAQTPVGTLPAAMLPSPAPTKAVPPTQGTNP